jgi:hypothetical protein
MGQIFFREAWQLGYLRIDGIDAEHASSSSTHDDYMKSQNHTMNLNVKKN